MAKKTPTEVLRRKELIKAAVDLRDVPEGTTGKILLSNGIYWIRYWVRFDNGVEMGSIHRDKLVRVNEWDQYLVDRELAAATDDRVRHCLASTGLLDYPSGALGPGRSDRHDWFSAKSEVQPGVGRRSARSQSQSHWPGFPFAQQLSLVLAVRNRRLRVVVSLLVVHLVGPAYRSRQVDLDVKMSDVITTTVLYENRNSSGFGRVPEVSEDGLRILYLDQNLLHRLLSSRHFVHSLATRSSPY